MLDRPLRRLIDPGLDAVARRVAARGIRADAVTLAGFAIGLAGAAAIAGGWYAAGLALVLLNRVADGLDGAVARVVGPTDFGGYLDIVCDFLFYALVVLAFALADPSRGLAAAYLLASFMGTGSTFLAYAILDAKQDRAPLAEGKAFRYLGGLTEGTETIAAFVLICLRPDWFVSVAVVFGTLCWVTAGMRAWRAWEQFGRP